MTSKGWVKVGWGIGAPIVRTMSPIGPGQCTPAIARISLASVLGVPGTGAAGVIYAGGGAFASGSGRSQLSCSFGRAGEMLPVPRGRAGAELLKLTFAVRTMAGGTYVGETWDPV